MLRSVALKNFIHFKDHQYLDLKRGANFLIGANCTGKSSIFELIRRCLSSKINTSASSIPDEKNVAYVVCEYFINNDCKTEIKEILVKFDCAYEQCPSTPVLNCLHASIFVLENTLYKLLILGNKGSQTPYAVFLDKRISSVWSPFKLDKPEHVKCYFSISNSMSSEIYSLLLKIKTPNAEKSVAINLLKLFNDLQVYTPEQDSLCEKILDILSLGFINTYARRSVGPAQWSRSENITLEKRDVSYRLAVDKAEIIRKLIDDTEHVDMNQEKDFFSLLTYPLKYEFSKVQTSDNKTIIVIKDVSFGIQVEYLKIPSGIIEAKIFSLLLSHKQYKTICLTDPDRACHPQMIDKLRNLVLRKFKDKTILISSHHPSMMSTWAIERTHVFRRKQMDQEITFHVTSVHTSITHRFSSEDMKKLLYASRVLFVEGPTDKIIIKAVFEHILTPGTVVCEFSKSEMDDFRQFLCGIQIVDVGGRTMHNVTMSLKKQLHFQQIYVYDQDAFFKMQKPKMERIFKELTEAIKEYGKEMPMNKTKQMQKSTEHVLKHLRKSLEKVLKERWFILGTLLEKESEYETIKTFCGAISEVDKINLEGNIFKIVKVLKDCSSCVFQESDCHLVRTTGFLTHFIVSETEELKKEDDLLNNYGIQLPETTNSTVTKTFASTTQSQSIFYWDEGNLEEMICKTYIPLLKDPLKRRELKLLLPSSNSSRTQDMKNMIGQIGYSELLTIALSLSTGEPVKSFLMFIKRLSMNEKFIHY